MKPVTAKIKAGTVVRITSKTSKFKGEIGEVIGYCHGKCPEICEVRLSNLQTIKICDYSLEATDMEMEYCGKKVELQTCPFCGSAPLIHSYRNRMQLWFRIRCGNENDTCRMIPETSASRTLEEAAADWNMRPEK